MANGDDMQLEDYWKGVPQDDMAPKDWAVKHCLVAISHTNKHLQCKNHWEAIRRLEKFMWVTLGIALLSTAVLVPVLVANWDKIFN